MRASQIVAVALVAGALLTAIGVRAWSNSSNAESTTATQANVQGPGAAGKDPMPAAPFAPHSTPAAESATVVKPATPTTLAATAAPMPPASASPTPAPVASAEDAAANASLEARTAQAASEAAHRTERYRHSRRDDGQHAE